VAALVVARHPDVVLALDRRVDARCIGPGLGAQGGVADQVLAALADPAPLVVDASALSVLGRVDGRAALDQRARRGWITVLTPHVGEFARLGFDAAGGPIAAAQRAAQATGAVVIRKGPGTVVATAEHTYVDMFGDANLATAGTGDVLAGLVAGMLATAASSSELTCAGAALVAARAVGLHGLAGRLAATQGRPVRAPDVAIHLRAAHDAACADPT
jgi:NAD(P)H-hydrate epimerase